MTLTVKRGPAFAETRSLTDLLEASPRDHVETATGGFFVRPTATDAQLTDAHRDLTTLLALPLAMPEIEG